MVHTCSPSSCGVEAGRSKDQGYLQMQVQGQTELKTLSEITVVNTELWAPVRPEPFENTLAHLIGHFLDQVKNLPLTT